jgi:toxin-antitoxin system PIN domain toxin
LNDTNGSSETKPYLLDVNVLLALAWKGHQHHDEAHEWFEANCTHGFCTCPLTQVAFVRMSCNPVFTKRAVAPVEAARLLSLITDMPEHQFWADDLPFSEVVTRCGLLVGHRQVTDAYLVSLAAARKGVLATFDQGVAAMRVRDDGEGPVVEILGTR